ncbi:hypothetical protein Tco_0012763 [Tanacetum coccineum]
MKKKRKKPDINEEDELFKSEYTKNSNVHFSSVLSDKVLYSWGDNEDVGRKVIVISSCLLEDIDSVTKIALLVMSGGRGALSESIDNFNRNICDLENCSFHAKVLCALACKTKYAAIYFHLSIASLMSLNPARCHGYPLDDECGNKLVKSTFCPVNGNELAALDSLKVGEHTVLLMPSFHYYIQLQHATSPIDFNIIEGTNLGSLSEGLIGGTPISSKGFAAPYIIWMKEWFAHPDRLAGSEEVIPILDVSQSFESTEAKDFRDSVLEV